MPIGRQGSWAAAGMRKSIPMASTTFAVGNEHIVLSPEECDGMLVCYNYFQDLKNPVNEAFVAKFQKRFGADYPNITELAMGTYQGFKLWAEGVKKAGSLDRVKRVVKILGMVNTAPDFYDHP